MEDTQMNFIASIIFFGLFLNFSYQLDTDDIVIVILNQNNAYHIKLAEELKENITVQAQDLRQKPPVVHLSHEDFNHDGDWTVLPVIPRIAELHQHNSSWVIFCQDVTRFHLQNLIDTLKIYDHKQDIWLGYGLFDREATIIHHFAFLEDPQSFVYPNMAAGFAISITLLKSMANRITDIEDSDIEFSIDASHELALFIWNKGKGITLVEEPTFCIKYHSHCASYVLPFSSCADPVHKENILFAVKTCKKFHKVRIPIVKRTWAKHVAHINFYSEENDNSIPTINLGIPNTERGHCGKTLAIMHHASSEMKKNPSILWLVITDDDTVLSSSRLQNLLSCYDSSSNVALGERYGFKVFYPKGYNYITGGGGMVFSAPLVHLLTEPGICECPSNQSPDDMYLGICLSMLGINITHSPSFHQARPPDYATDYLASHEAVSFHKHWMIDPVSVYEEWFSRADLDPSTASTTARSEL